MLHYLFFIFFILKCKYKNRKIFLLFIKNNYLNKKMNYHYDENDDLVCITDNTTEKDYEIIEKQNKKSNEILKQYEKNALEKYND